MYMCIVLQVMIVIIMLVTLRLDALITDFHPIVPTFGSLLTAGTYLEALSCNLVQL